MKQITAISTNEIARYTAKNNVLNNVDMFTATVFELQIKLNR